MRRHNLRRGYEARIQALETAISDYFTGANLSLEKVRRPMANQLDDARLLLNTKSEPEDYFVPIALIFIETAERQFQGVTAQIDAFGGPRKAVTVSDD